MPGSAPALDRPALRAALSHMRIDPPAGSPDFEAALAEETGWTPDFAGRVADEYCGFLYLAATAGFEVTPSQAVDRAWHLHLSWPHYRDVLCRDIIGRPLDHRPGTGHPDDEARYALQYAETLALYQRVFGKPPPADIWPRPPAAGAESDGETGFESEEGYLEAGREQLRMGSRRLSLVSLAGALASAAFGFPMLGFTLGGAALLLFLIGQTPAPGRRDRRSDDGGGGCGGGGSDGGSDHCGASCGGSCGGGGCGGGCGGD